MRKRQKNTHGVITVMVSLMLAGILSLGTLVIEAGRLQAAKTQLEDANLSAGTSMIAAYDSGLFERYGLFAIDNDQFNLGRYRRYLDFNSDNAAGYEGNNLSTLYTVQGAEIEGVYNLTYPSVLKRQLLSRAKYHVIPQDYVLNYYNMAHYLADYQEKATYVADALRTVASGSATQGSLDDIPADMKSALGNLYIVFENNKKYKEEYNVTINAADMAGLPSRTGTVTHEGSVDDMEAINNAVNDAGSVLGSGALVSNVGSAYTEVDVSLDTSFASTARAYLADLQKLPAKAVDMAVNCRKLMLEINAALNVLGSDKEGNLLLNSYITDYFPSVNHGADGYTGCAIGQAVTGMSDAAFSGACVEYVFSENASERYNQQTAYDYIMATRLVSNLHATIVNSPFFNGNNACSVAAHIAWAYYETHIDAELLFKHNAVVPLNKYHMILPIDNAAAVNSAFASKDFLEGLRTLGILKDNKFTVSGYDKTTYRDALALALWFVPNSEKIMNIADLIQLEMRYKERHVEHSAVSFRMSEQNTFCRVKCTGTLNSVLPIISLDTDGGTAGVSIQSVKYVGY